MIKVHAARMVVHLAPDNAQIYRVPTDFQLSDVRLRE